METLTLLVALVAGITGSGTADAPNDAAVVDIIVDGEQDCTGSVVSPHVILTAAHCIFELEEGAVQTVFTGLDQSQPGGGRTFTVKEAHSHPQYDFDNDLQDIGVLILNEPVDVKPLAYARTALSASAVGQPLRMIGYGDNTVREPTSGGGRRRQATAPMISFNRDYVRVGMASATQCYGDSGGPVLLMINGVETIVGVDSTQDEDDCVGVNSNTRVDTFAAFVDQYVNQFDPPSSTPPPTSSPPTNPVTPPQPVTSNETLPSVPSSSTASPTPASATVAPAPTPDDMAAVGCSTGFGTLAPHCACLMLLAWARRRRIAREKTRV